MPPRLTLCEPTRLDARIMNIISGGRSWSMLLMESKLARSFSLSSFLSASVMLSPNLLLLLVERYKKIRGKY